MITWDTSPSDLADEFDAWGELVNRAVLNIAHLIANEWAAMAKDRAPWTDRTGTARAELFAAMDDELFQGAAGAIVEVYLSHGLAVPYGKYLELANGQRFAVIAPTLDQMLPRVEQLLQQLFD